MAHDRPTARMLSRGSWFEARRIGEILRTERIGGALLLIATVLALAWANSPWSGSYESLRQLSLGPASLHLDLSLTQWAADGLLAIFFFVAGLELKREFIAGDLRDPRRAAIPVAAAVSGMVVPAAFYTAMNLDAGSEALRGWAIPTATDIAFAVAALAVIGPFLPSALRTFLLTLAVVDDLLAITIIAVFYTGQLELKWLLLAVLPLASFTALVQRRVRSWWVLVPLAAAVWALVHASGVHATVAGVVLGFAVPVLRRSAQDPGLAEHFEHRWRPVSAGVAVPIFAFLSAGVAIGGASGLGAALGDSVALGVVVGLVVGKTVGVFGATFLMSRLTGADLDDDLGWLDVLGLAMLAGIGFTVSLLIGALAFGEGSERGEHVKLAVLTGSVAAALLATVVLRLRNRTYRRMWQEERADTDRDGVPDIYQKQSSQGAARASLRDPEDGHGEIPHVEQSSSDLRRETPVLRRVR